MNILRSLWEDMKAAWRGETRTAPRAARGRVYARKDGTGGAGKHQVRSEPIISVGVRVVRADGSVEDKGSVPGVATQQSNQVR